MFDLLLTAVSAATKSAKETMTVPFIASAIAALAAMASATGKKKRKSFYVKLLQFVRKQKRASSEQKMAIIAVIIIVVLLLGFSFSWGLGLLVGGLILLAFLNGLSKGR